MNNYGQAILATFLGVSLLAPKTSLAQEDAELAIILNYASDAKTGIGALSSIKSAYDFANWLVNLGSSSGPSMAQIEQDIYNVGLSLSYQIRDQSIAAPISTINGAYLAARACVQGWNGQGTFTCPDVARAASGAHSNLVTDMVAAVLQLEDPVYQYRLFVESATNGAWKGIVKSRPQTTQMNLQSPLYGGLQVFDWRRVVPTLMEAYRHELEVAAISDANYACDPYWYGEVLPDHINRLNELKTQMLSGIQCNLKIDYKECPENPENSGGGCPETNGHTWPDAPYPTQPQFGVRYNMVCADMFTGVSSDVFTSPYCQLTSSAIGTVPEVCAIDGCSMAGYPPWYSPYTCPGRSNRCTESTSYFPDNFDLPANCTLNTGLCCTSGYWCGGSSTASYLSSKCGPIIGPRAAASSMSSLKGQVSAKMPLASMQATIDAMQAIVDYGCPSQAGWNQGRVPGTTQRYPIDFNVVAFQSATDIQHIAGPLAAGGEVRLNSFSLNPIFSAGFPVGLIAGGALSLSSGTVGGDVDVVTGQNISIAQTVTQNGGVCRTNSTSPIDFGDLQSKMTAVSDKLKTLPSTAPTPSYSKLTFTVNNPISNIFSVSADTLASVFTVEFVLSDPAYVRSTVIINVTGQHVTIENLGFTRNGIDVTKVLWNFADTTSLFVQSVAFPGSALAPRADALMRWGSLDGTLVAKSITGYNEYHPFPFAANLRPLLQ